MRRPPFALLLLLAALPLSGDDPRLGAIPWERFQSDRLCATCHTDFARQHEQAMMSQAYVHHWDEIEYFRLAVPHAEMDPKVAEVKAGCNGCHAPLAYLAGKIPPPKPAEKSRANEAVSCDVCHTITGFEGDTPFNFNWTIEPGRVKQGPREGVKSPHHDTVRNEFLGTAEYCGTCHNEKSPYGTWVKATQLEWKKGPHAKNGIVCQDCHMPPAPGRSAKMGSQLADARQHLFHGAHDPGKLAGVVEVRIHPETREAEPGEKVRFTAVVVNAKAGHPLPTGSAEERLLWLEVEAVDPQGGVHPIAVDPKGFEGEAWTIGDPASLAYQDMGPVLGLDSFPGVRRDGPIPAGARIFRMPYLDPQGRMTIMQWNTASFGTDYRLWPLQAVQETYTWTVPETATEGTVVVRARIRYSRLVSSVAELLEVPAEESEPQVINVHETRLRVVE